MALKHYFKIRNPLEKRSFLYVFDGQTGTVSAFDVCSSNERQLDEERYRLITSIDEESAVVLNYFDYDQRRPVGACFAPKKPIIHQFDDLVSKVDEKHLENVFNVIASVGGGVKDQTGQSLTKNTFVKKAQQYKP